MNTTPAPYPPSALNRLFVAIEGLPGGGWWVYLLPLGALVVYHHVSLWLTGSRPMGSISSDGLSALAYGPSTLFVAHYLTRVAARAIEAFRPASGLSDEDYTLRRYELLTLPAGRLWVVLLIGTGVAVGSLLSASATALTPYGSTRLVTLVVFGPAAVFGYGMMMVFLWQTIRQLRAVVRLHREATAIDLFDTSPIYAFSRFTVQIGIAFVFAGYYTLIANAAFQAGNVISLTVLGGCIVMGVACFVVPLWGIHGRLAKAKATLVRGGSLRAQALQEELYRRVDDGNLAGVIDLTNAFDGIRSTSERIDRLPTWPWPPQVLRGFVSAILLPVVVFFITNYVGTQLN